MRNVLIVLMAMFACTAFAEDKVFHMKLEQIRVNGAEWEVTSGLMIYKPSGEAIIELGQDKVYVFFDVSSKELIDEDLNLHDYYGTLFFEGKSERCVVIWGHFDDGSYLKVMLLDREGIFEYMALDI